MENNTLFVADADIDVRLRAGSRRLYNDREGNAISTSTSNNDGINEPTTERTSLLRASEDIDARAEGLADNVHTNLTGEDFANLPWQKRPSIYWLLPPFMLFAFAFGAIVVPRLNLILALICRQYFADKQLLDPNSTVLPVVLGSENPQCRIPEIQSLVSRFTLYGSLIAGLLSAVASPKLGSWSDRFGRKKIITISATGMLLAEAITIMTATWPDIFSVNWLLLGFFFDGICGSFITIMAISHSYAADCTSPAQRNVVFGYFHGCLFSGIALGPFFGGWLVSVTEEILSVFYFALIGHLCAMLFVLLVVPESLSIERQRTAKERHRLEKVSLRGGLDRTWLDTLKSMNILAPLEVLFPRGEGSNRALRLNLILLSAVDTIMFGVAMGSVTIVVIYSEYMFGWDTYKTATFVSIVNTCRVLVLVGVLPVVTLIVRGRPSTYSRGSAKSGMDVFDINIIRTAVLFDMLGYIGYATVKTGPLFILSGAIASVGGMGSPTLQSALTKHVPRDRTGQLLGATGLLHALARVVAPTIFNLIYSYTVAKFAQTVFVCLAATFGVALMCSFFIQPHIYLRESETPVAHYSDLNGEEEGGVR